MAPAAAAAAAPAAPLPTAHPHPSAPPSPPPAISRRHPRPSPPSPLPSPRSSSSSSTRPPPRRASPASTRSPSCYSTTWPTRWRRCAPASSSRASRWRAPRRRRSRRVRDGTPLGRGASYTRAAPPLSPRSSLYRGGDAAVPARAHRGRGREPRRQDARRGAVAGDDAPPLPLPPLPLPLPLPPPPHLLHHHFTSSTIPAAGARGDGDVAERRGPLGVGDGSRHRLQRPRRQRVPRREDRAARARPPRSLS